MEEQKESLILCGDIHGEFNKLVWLLHTKLKLKNISVIVVGDFGIGFDNSIKKDYAEREKILKENNIKIYALRGNHDDPAYFKDIDYFKFDNLKFLKDHTVYNIAGRDIYIIGGANSTDISWRLDWNLEHKDSNKKVWWEDEDIVRIPLDKIPKRVDIVLSHEAPLIFSPIPIRSESLSVEQFGKIVDSRNYLKEVLNNINTDLWVYGHYHTSYSGNYGKTLYRCLAEMELFEVPDKKDNNIQGEIVEDPKSDNPYNKA